MHTRTDRLRLWIAPLCLLLAAAAQAAERRDYRFEVLLDNRPIGQHLFTVVSAPDGTRRVESEARFDVKLLGITAYRYRHRAAEHWIDGCLSRIEAATSDNGRDLAVRGAAREGRFRLEAAPRPGERAGCVASYAYWDPDTLLAQRELLNPQTGEFDAVTIEPVGTETLQLKGMQVLARRYRVRGENLAIDLWYSAGGEWLQLESTARGNRRLIYRPA